MNEEIWKEYKILVMKNWEESTERGTRLRYLDKLNWMLNEKNMDV